MLRICPWPLSLIAGPDPRDPRIVPAPLGDPADVPLQNLRLAYYVEGGLFPPVADIGQMVENVAQALAADGFDIKADAPTALPQAAELYPQITFAERGVALRRALVHAGTSEAGPHFQRLLDEAEAFESVDLAIVLENLDHFRQQMAHFMAGYDAIICPPEVYPAIPHGGTVSGSVLENKYMMWAHMNAYNLTGWPAAVVRAGTTSNGLPIGVQIVARPWREDVALAIASHIEEVFGGWQPSGVL